jgi:hypothetical protein
VKYILGPLMTLYSKYLENLMKFDQTLTVVLLKESLVNRNRPADFSAGKATSYPPMHSK